MRLRVSSTCGRKSSLSWSGQSLSTVASAEMKCSLNVAIACSAALTQWLWGRTRWMSMLLVLMWASTDLGNSLSIAFGIGAYPHAFRLVRMLVNAVIMAPSFLNGIAHRRIAFRS